MQQTNKRTNERTKRFSEPGTKMLNHGYHTHERYQSIESAGRMRERCSWSSYTSSATGLSLPAADGDGASSVSPSPRTSRSDDACRHGCVLVPAGRASPLPLPTTPPSLPTTPPPARARQCSLAACLYVT
jgi:hypothetical protein